MTFKFLAKKYNTIFIGKKANIKNKFENTILYSPNINVFCLYNINLYLQYIHIYMEYYKTIYPHFDEARFRSLMNNFGLDERRKIRTFSKGMKKQVSVICAVSSGADYLFCDETFDGLDPVARQAVKSLFAGDVAEFCATPVIASHNLRELEDFCDCIGLLHRGGILVSRDLDDMKLNIQKIQLIPGDIPAPEILRDLDVMDTQRSGRMLTVTVRGNRAETEARLRAANPLYFELLPLSLEEIFIAETEVNGYDARKLIV